jgi:hypothetical protein
MMVLAGFLIKWVRSDKVTLCALHCINAFQSADVSQQYVDSVLAYRMISRVPSKC